MRTLLARFRDFYGSHPLHLLTILAGFAVVGYVLAVFKPVTLWNPQVWWQSIAVWFTAAIIAHDLVLFPVYALADRLLLGTGAGRRPVTGPRVSGADHRSGVARRAQHQMGRFHRIQVQVTWR